MDKAKVLEALKFLRHSSLKRKFDQSIDLTVNFKGIDFKKAENRLDVEVRMPHKTGKVQSIKSVLFAKDKNFAQDAKDSVTRVILDTEVTEMKKKDVDNLLKEYNVLLAEGPALLVVAKYLGQHLAPKGMMPQLVQGTKGAVEQALKNVSTFTKVSNKKGKFMPVVHVTLGKESFKDEDMAENAAEVFRSLLNVLPGREANIKSSYIKATMGRPVKIGEKYDFSESTSASTAMKGKAKSEGAVQ